MANDYFSFKQFTVRQDRCAMKVGTDGTLLGAWAHGGQHILDIGSGTGLIALMMAQRFPDATVVAVDIDAEACRQAAENVAASPFEVTVVNTDVKEMDSLFDSIVSNPPYFIDSLECTDHQRTIARHASSLTYAELVGNAYRLLTSDGEFSVVIPAECKSKLEGEAALQGFFKVRECAVKTTPRKATKRYLLAFRKHRVENAEITEGVIETSPNVRSEWYQQLTKDFYL